MKIIRDISCILLLIGLLLATAACSDEPFGADPVDYDAPEIRFAIDEFPVMQTRGDAEFTFNENYVKDVWVGIFADGVLRYHAIKDIDRDPGDSVYTMRLLLNSYIRDMKHGVIYFVANRTSLIENEKDGIPLTEEDFVKILDDLELNDANHLAMWTRKELDSYRDIAAGDNNQQALYQLKRNRAKVTMKTGSGPEVERFHILGCHEHSYICGDGLPVEGAAGYDYTWVSQITEEGPAAYPFPVKDGQPQVIFEMSDGNGAPGFYRGEFAVSGNQDILANHHYELEIVKVTGTAFPTIQAALAGAENVILQIYDRTPVVYNMISDGSNELGVCDTIRYDGRSGEYELFVKVSSPVDNFKNALTVEVADEDKDWISVTTGQTQRGTTVTEDGKLKNIVWSYGVTLAAQDAGVSRIGHIKVSWENGRLERTVAVYKERSFDTASLSVALSASNGESISDYLKFVSGEGDEGENTLLRGVQPEQNLGRVRNAGFHFPMGLRTRHAAAGETPSAIPFVKYTYTIHPPEGKSIKEVALASASSPFAGRVKISDRQADGSYTLTWSGGDSYDYLVATEGLRVTLTDASGRDYSYYYDLYHTGFFYHDIHSSLYERQGKVADGWYYYEVETVSTGLTTEHWLDRNIGATASAYSIESTGGGSIFSQSGENPYKFRSESEGGLYCAVKYAGNGKYEAVSEVMPPGFKIPTVREWQGLLSADNFSINHEYEQGKLYWNAILEGKGKNIYFPKTRYISPDTNGKEGLPNTGYYWTSTEAIGVSSPEQMGYWVQLLRFQDSKASFSRMRYRAENDKYTGNNPAYSAYGDGTLAMSLRCVDDSPGADNMTQLNFSVKGYTHIFLYVEEGEGDAAVRVPLNNWPGDRITLAQNFDDSSPYIEHRFSTYMDVPGKFYVVLTDVSAEGKILAYWDGERREVTNPLRAPNPETVEGYCQKRVSVGEELNKYYIYPDKTVGAGGSWTPIADHTVYFDNDQDNRTPWVHHWGGPNNPTDWPGDRMTRVEGFSNLFSQVVPYSRTSLIFNYEGKEETKSMDVVKDGVYYRFGYIDTYENYKNNRHPYYLRGLNYEWNPTAAGTLEGVKLTRVEEGLYVLNGWEANAAYAGKLMTFKMAHITWNSGLEYAAVEGTQTITDDNPTTRIGPAEDGRDLSYAGLSGTYNITVDLRDPDNQTITFDKPVIKMGRLDWAPGIRGSVNSWGYDAMTYNEEKGRYELLLDFRDYEEFDEYLNGSVNYDRSNPRFLIAASDWSRKLGAFTVGENVNGDRKILKLKYSGEDIGAKIKGKYWVYLEQLLGGDVRVRLEQAL